MYLEGLSQVIKTQGLTYKELAQLSGVDKEHISLLARQRHQSTPKTASKLAIALNVGVGDLIKAPSVNGLLTQILAEMRTYRRFCEDALNEYGQIFDDIER